MTGCDFTDGRTARDLRADMVDQRLAYLRFLDDKAEAAAGEARAQAFDMRHRRMSDEEHAQIVRRVFRAADNGQTEVIAMTFPAALCTDKGRAIGNCDTHWPQTLPLKAKSFFDHWRRIEGPMGYGLRAQILTYPDGLPGDVGLILDWRAASERRVA